MTKPTEEQIGLCAELIKTHYRQYGNTASDTRLASLVYSIHSTLTGDGKPAADHAAALEEARQARKAQVAAAIEEDDKTEPDPAKTDEKPVEPAPAFASGRAAPEQQTEPEQEIDEDEFYTREELEAMTVEQLRELADEGDLSYTTKTTKVELIDAIMAAE